MANVLTVPNSGIISFDSRAYSNLTVPPLSTSARIIYDGGGGVNITSYTTAATALDRFSVDGTQGRLFSVTDALTGTLFSVNNITGLPILEVQDSDTVIAGQYNTNAFVLSGTRLGLGTTPIGTNRLSVSGNSTFVGTISATGTIFANSISKNIWIPAAAWIPRSSQGCGVGSRELSANKTNYDELLFDAGVDEFAQALVVMPSNYNNGTVAARFYWTCNDPSAPGGGSNVIWVFAGRAFSDIDVLDAAMGTSQSVLDSVTVGNYVNKLHISEPTPPMTLAGTPAANRPVLFQISRNATSFGDSVAVDARLLGVEIIYTAA